MQVTRSIALLVIGASLASLTTGCRKKVAVAPPAPPAPVKEVAPPPSAPTVTLTAEPSTVEPGQPVTLKWSTTDSTEATISGVGAVDMAGKVEVRPEESITYELVAKGPGGSATVSATVNVVALPPPVPVPPVIARSLQDRLEMDVSDAFFDYDKSDVREDARTTLAKDAAALRSILADFPNAVIVLEGHCDERGSAEYNLGLGDRRASAASEYLAQLGVDPIRLQAVSYGKERPQCTEATETCWQKNRRVHFSAGAAEITY